MYYWLLGQLALGSNFPKSLFSYKILLAVSVSGFGAAHPQTSPAIQF